MKNEKWIRSSWAISIITATFSFLLTIGYDYFKKNPILTTITGLLKAAWNFLISILNLELKVWWILVGIVIVLLAIFIISKFQTTEDFKPVFYNYTEDKFKKWKWSWSWALSDTKKTWSIENLIAHCPNCDTPLIDNSTTYGLAFTCPRCDFNAADHQCDEPYKIERIILDNIERKRLNKSNL